MDSSGWARRVLFSGWTCEQYINGMSGAKYKMLSIRLALVMLVFTVVSVASLDDVPAVISDELSDVLLGKPDVLLGKPVLPGVPQKIPGAPQKILGPGVPLGSAGDFSILCKAGISTVPSSVIVGNIGVSPIAATAMTGFSLTADPGNEFSTSPQVTSRE
jgi:hypothetical protein